ncbi:MAG: IS110 family transposase [Stellaceae bacterium]
MSEDIRWWCGLDWGSEKHHAYLLDAKGGRLGEREVAHGGAGLGELCAWLIEVTGSAPGQIAVAIETTHGPVVETFLERGFRVYAINPKQLDRFRDRFTVAGAKDDSRDAHVLADSLRTDARAFRLLSVEDPVVIELREWSRMADDLKAELNRLGNRLREQLWRYYPQALEVAGNDLTAAWFLALWHQAPTPAKAAKLRKTTVEGLLKTHRIRRLDAAEVLRTLGQKPVTVAPGTTEAAMGHIRLLIPRIGLINDQIKATHRRLDELCAKLEAPENEPGQGCEHRDATILRSLPGVGRIVLAAMLAEASEPLRRRDYHALRALSGQAPVTRRSGKSCVALRRYACNKRLADALYHWSRVAVQHDPRSQQRYAALRQRGHGHARALRTVGDRLLYLACVLLERGVIYDPDHKSPQAAAA